MKSGVQRNYCYCNNDYQWGLNAMKSGVQHVLICEMRIEEHGLNAMKSGVRLCGEFNFGDVKRCLKGNEERGCVEEEI